MQITSNTHSYSVYTNDKATKEQDYYDAVEYQSVLNEEEDKTYSVLDDFLQDLHATNAPQLQSTLMQDTLKQKVNEYAQVMLQKNGDMPQNELETEKLLAHYKNELLQEYKESIANATNTSISAQQQAIIQLLMEENTKKESSLEKLLAATEAPTQTQRTKTPEEIIAEYRAMPGQGGIAYEGMFEEQQAAALAKHEPYFQKEYEHYEKYKDIFTPIYSNYTTQKANKIIQELNAQFPEFQAMREKAYMGGTEQDKEAFEDMFWDYQAYNKYLREKYDMDMSTGGFTAATKESSKAYNYAVYDALESGLSIKEATAKARSLLTTFGGAEAQTFSLMFFSGYPEDMEAATQAPQEEIDYDKQIDLREYGFEHNFWTDTYLSSFNDDFEGIKAKIMYDIELYSFLLENNDLIDKKLDELKERAYETEYGKEWYDDRNEDGKFNERFKSSFKEKYDNALYAREIHDKYADKIFDHSLLDAM